MIRNPKNRARLSEGVAPLRRVIVFFHSPGNLENHQSKPGAKNNLNTPTG